MNLVEIVVRTHSNSLADESWSDVEVSVNAEYVCALGGFDHEEVVDAFQRLAEALGAEVGIEVIDE